MPARTVRLLFFSKANKLLRFRAESIELPTFWILRCQNVDERHPRRRAVGQYPFLGPKYPFARYSSNPASHPMTLSVVPAFQMSFFSPAFGPGLTWLLGRYCPFVKKSTNYPPGARSLVTPAGQPEYPDHNMVGVPRYKTDERASWRYRSTCSTRTRHIPNLPCRIVVHSNSRRASRIGQLATCPLFFTLDFASVSGGYLQDLGPMDNCPRTH